MNAHITSFLHDPFRCNRNLKDQGNSHGGGKSLMTARHGHPLFWDGKSVCRWLLHCNYRFLFFFNISVLWFKIKDCVLVTFRCHGNEFTVANRFVRRNSFVRFVWLAQVTMDVPPRHSGTQCSSALGSDLCYTHHVTSHRNFFHNSSEHPFSFANKKNVNWHTTASMLLTALWE